MHRTNKIRFLAVTACAALAVLAACSAPNSLPRGYVYHKDAYKSPNPPESPKFSSQQRATMGPEQADQFRLSVYTLVENLTARAGMPPKPVYVVKPETMTPFYANIDNDLRESLRHMGYRLSDTPDGAYAIAYNADIPKKEKAKDAVVIDTSPNVTLTLFVLDSVSEEARVLTQESGSFYIRGAEELNVPFASYPGLFIPALSNSADQHRLTQLQQ